MYASFHFIFSTNKCMEILIILAATENAYGIFYEKDYWLKTPFIYNNATSFSVPLDLICITFQTDSHSEL